MQYQKQQLSHSYFCSSCFKTGGRVGRHWWSPIFGDPDPRSDVAVFWNRKNNSN